MHVKRYQRERIQGGVSSVLTLLLLGLGSAQAQTGGSSYCTGTFATVAGDTSTGSGRVVWHNPLNGYNKQMTTGDTSGFASYGFNGSELNSAAVDAATGQIYWLDRGGNYGSLTRNNRYAIVWKYDPFTGVKTNLGYLDAGTSGSEYIGAVIANGSLTVTWGNYTYASVSLTSLNSGTENTAHPVTRRTYTIPQAKRTSTNGDIAVDNLGKVWLLYEDSTGTPYLGELNTSTAAVSNSREVTGLGTSANLSNGLAYDPAYDVFYVSDGTNIWTINRSTFAATRGNAVSSGLTDLASCGTPALVPQVSKAFDRDTVQLDPATGQAVSRLTVTVQNDNRAPIMLFQNMVDALPAVSGGGQMTVSSAPNYQAVCINSSGATITNNSGYNSLSYQSSSTAAVQSQPPGPTAGATSWSLPANTIIPSGTCTFSFNVVATQVGTYNNVIPAGAQTSAGVDADGAQASLNVVPAAPPSLSITKTDGGATFYTGNTATYTLTVTNTAANSATQGAINIRDALPAGLTFASVAVSGGVGGTITNASAAGSSGTVGWDFTPTTPMTQNQSVTFTLTVNVGASTPTGTNSITNYASVGGGGGAAAPTPSSSCTTQCGSDSTTVSAPSNSDLSITKTDGTSSIPANGSTTYTIRVTNSGPAVVTGAVLRDAPPTGMTFGAVACSTASGNVCTTAPTPAQLSSGFALPTLASGAFYEITVAASTTLTSGSVANTATVTAPASITDTNTANNTATDTNTVATVSTTQPARNVSSFPAACDVVDWSRSSITGTAVGQTGTKTFNSRNNLGLSVNLVPATSASNGIVGLNTGFTNYGSWYEVRAVSTSLSPNNTATAYGGAFVTRAGGDGQTNTVTITFPHPVINVRFGITDLDAVGGASVSDQGDWMRVTAGYGGTTFSPDTLIADGHGLTVKGYTTSGSTAPGTAASGSSMTLPVPGRGNSTMGAGSNPNTLNTLMGTDTAYGTQVTDLENGGGAVNRQGQGVAYFKGPLTTLTIVTGSKKTSSGNAIAFGNIDFCSPSMTVSKAVGTPVLQSDASHNIPYTLTYRNTSYNQGLFPDTTVRDDPFQPSFPTPSGFDPWADLKPQLSDTVVPQILANTNIQSAAVVGSPKITFANAASTRNLDASDANPSFDGTATNPTLMTSNTDARVSAGGSFDARFTVNAVIKSGVTTQQTVNNQATATGSLNTATATLNATSATVAATLTPAVKLTLSKVVDQKFVRYLGDPVSPDYAELNYTIRVTNPSTATAASGVVITDTLPAQVTYVSSSPAASISGRTLTWNVGTVAANTSATVTVKVKVPLASAVEASQPQATWTNTASVSGTNATSASASATTDTVYTKLFKQVHNLGTNPPAEVPQLSPAWSSSGQGLPGDVLEYCIDFYNYGSVALNNYIVKDAVPTNTTYVPDSATVKTGTMTTTPVQPFPGVVVGEANGVVTATISSLAPQASGSLCFRTRIR